MRTSTKILFGFIAFSVMTSCKKENSIPANVNSQIEEIRSAPPGGNYWSERKFFPSWIDGATGFSVNGKGYLVGGTVYGEYSDKVWEYDPTANTWTEKSSIPFARPRSHVAVFVIDDKAYIVGGTGDRAFEGYDPIEETWEYTPLTNGWRQRRNLNEPRSHAIGFSINGKGYIATGRTNSILRNDLVEYDPIANSWSTKAPLVDFTAPDNDLRRYSAVAVVINNKAYVGTGLGNSNIFRNDWWQYNPLTNSWVRKGDFPGGARYGAFAFSIGSIGYLGTGNRAGGFYNDLWSYNASSDSWIQRADMPGYGRTNAVAFVIGSYGYAGMGHLDYLRYAQKLYRYTRSTTGGLSQ